MKLWSVPLNMQEKIINDADGTKTIIIGRAITAATDKPMSVNYNIVAKRTFFIHVN